MKIKDDFVTNSSSTSFIFGSKNNDESVDTIFNLIRMICNELVLLYNRMKNDKRIIIPSTYEDGMFLDVKLKNLLNDEYVNNTLFCILQNPYMYKYFINLVCMEKEIIECLKDIIKYIKYNDYREYSEYDTIGIHETYCMDEDFAKDCYDDFAFDYYKNLGLEEANIYDIMNTIKDNNYNTFVIKNLGQVYVIYEEYIFGQLFDSTLEYFSNYSYNVYNYLERD